jgi:hypothetical protein
MFSAPFLSTLLHRVKAVVRRVGRPVAERMRAVRITPNAPMQEAAPISPALHGLMQGWMRIRLRALSALMERIRSGETLERPVVVLSRAKSAGTPMTRDAGPPQERLPHGFGWMCAFGPDVRRDGAAFAAWLNEPWMKAMVLAAPERMAGLIGPILTATGEPRPHWFPVVAKRARRPRPSRESEPRWEVKSPLSCEDGVSETELRAAAPSHGGDELVAIQHLPSPPSASCSSTVPFLRSRLRSCSTLAYHRSSLKTAKPQLTKSENLDDFGGGNTLGYFVTIS